MLRLLFSTADCRATVTCERHATMSILYVDPEHDVVVNDPVKGPHHHAAVLSARARIASVAGSACDVAPASSATPPEIEERSPTAIVIGGCATDWAIYDFSTLSGLIAVIRAASVPILGICGGHQLIGYAHGAGWGPLGRLHPDEVDPDPQFAPGQRKESGFMSVGLDSPSSMFRGLRPEPVFFQAHYWQLTDVPSVFSIRAHSRWCPIQAIERTDRPVFGVQFHPECFDAAHPDGEQVLRNFFAAL